MSDRRIAALAVATVIGAALITTPTDARLGVGSHGSFVRGPVFVGRPAVAHRPFFPGRRFVRPFLGWEPVPYGWGWPDYGYGDIPNDAFGDNTVPEPPRTFGCNRSVETVTVPSEDGGTRQIKMIRCP